MCSVNNVEWTHCFIPSLLPNRSRAICFGRCHLAIIPTSTRRRTTRHLRPPGLIYRWFMWAPKPLTLFFLSSFSLHHPNPSGLFWCAIPNSPVLLLRLKTYWHLAFSSSFFFFFLLSLRLFVCARKVWFCLCFGPWVAFFALRESLGAVTFPFFLLSRWCVCTHKHKSLAILFAPQENTLPEHLFCVSLSFLYSAGLRVFPALPRIAGFPAHHRQESHRSEIRPAGIVSPPLIWLFYIDRLDWIFNFLIISFSSAAIGIVWQRRSARARLPQDGAS